MDFRRPDNSKDAEVVNKYINAMMTLLEVVKDEVGYIASYNENDMDNHFRYLRDDLPNGTLIRENLKTVSRMASRLSKMIKYGPYEDRLLDWRYKGGRDKQ